MSSRTTQHCKQGRRVTTPTQRPGCTYSYPYRLLQILWFACRFQVFKSGKPLLWTGLRQFTVICSDNAMDSTALFNRQMRNCKVADLRMDSVHTCIELHK